MNATVSTITQCMSWQLIQHKGIRLHLIALLLIVAQTIPLLAAESQEMGDKQHTTEYRGYTIVVDEFQLEDLALMKQQKVNLIRCMLYRTWTQHDRLDPQHYQVWLDKCLKKMDAIIQACEPMGIKVIVDLHTAPGEYGKEGSHFLFYEQKYADHFLAVWKMIAQRFAGNKALYAFELLNEPVEQFPDQKKLHSVIEIQKQAALVIRQIDKDTPLIFSSNLWNGPVPFFDAPVEGVGEVIYSVHFYQDMFYSHQGVKGFSEKPCSYPGKAGGGYFGKQEMRQSLKNVIDFQKKHGVKIFVGEFSVVRWANGGAQWLEDSVALFEECGWDWNYHAWCNYHHNKHVETLWSLEAKNGAWGDYTSVLADQPTDRKRVIINALSAAAKGAVEE